MPANLTPQYFKAEQDYRRASTPDEELSCLQVMLRELPKHKGTDKLQAELKAKIARVRAAQEAAKNAPKKGAGLRIARQGAGRAVLIGAPNTGKSSLLAALTRATPGVAPYPFTTREPFLGMMPYEDIMIQLVDTPPITADYLDINLQGLIRGADIVLLLIDLGDDDGIPECQDVLDRLQQTQTRLGANTYLDENDVGRSFTRTFAVPNKIDLPGADERLQLLHELCPLGFPELVISTQTSQGLDALKHAVFAALDVVRIYTKLPTEKEPDFETPYTIRRGETLVAVASQIHHDFANSLKSARVWGSQLHPGTQVKPDYVPQDKDVVELHV